ncbi:hypothetical protein Q4511_01240 [Paracoccus sp. 1_MG-2023]|uniref:hypothetical protein n=1 Tax=unclassified Paracoccus (in: a-proteobacteria) TaxID=2688777 RepID=UPI001C0A4C30|nr:MULTISPECIES: hypothetical protein [unclassified Paracoccus (in: a-proteobacteria)]MBU2957616.1 hypothetical protein [Paracoccus sp. C2R09]MDO6667537.1 hypothetical protein [Paracoccus sp. 1_MG-2023]
MTLEQMIDEAMSAHHGCKHFSLSYDPTKAMGWCAAVSVLDTLGEPREVRAEGESAQGALGTLGLLLRKPAPA